MKELLHARKTIQTLNDEGFKSWLMDHLNDGTELYYRLIEPATQGGSWLQLKYIYRTSKGGRS